jgi:signal transduction histidine kinase
MQAMPGSARPAGRTAGRTAWRALLEVLAGPDPAPAWSWRSPRQRRLACAALGAAALLLGWASVASVLTHGQASGSSSGTGGQPGRAPCHLSAAVGFCQRSGHLQLSSAPPAAMWLLALAAVVPLALVLRWPLLSWRVGWLGLLLVPLFDLHWWGGWPWDPVQIPVLLAVLCAAGIHRRRPALYWLFALTLLPWWCWAIQDRLGLVTAVLGSAAFGAIAVAVDGAAARRQAQRTLADQAEQTELERARRAVLEERARIARELHDVVAHHMSLVAIRAESAPHRLGALPDPVRAEFGALSDSAREALADMRRLLGVLRSDQPAARAPQPGLPDVPALVDTARQAGMTVELSAPAGAASVPPSTGVCAYRIIQEALSNAGQHAAGAPVSVTVQHDTDTVTLRVANGPFAPAPVAPAGHRPGHGLAGMRERAELLGGSLSAGPAPDGGFVVRAVLPVAGAPA